MAESKNVFNDCRFWRIVLSIPSLASIISNPFTRRFWSLNDGQYKVSFP